LILAAAKKAFMQQDVTMLMAVAIVITVMIIDSQWLAVIVMNVYTLCVGLFVSNLLPSLENPD
jgi:hypothetical protein